MFLNNETLKIVIGYALCIAAHFGAAHFYARYCTEPSIIGFVTSPFMTMSPQCQAGRWIIYNAAYSINIMWILTAKWLIFKIADVLPIVKGQQPSSFNNVNNISKEPTLKEKETKPAELVNYDSDKSDDTLTI
jgi:hypothetical protein